MEETGNPLQLHIGQTLNSLKRFEHNIAEFRKRIAKLRAEKSSLEENLQLLGEKLDELNSEKSAERLKLEKVRTTIGQIEAFRAKMTETFDAMLNNIRKERDIFTG